MPPLKRNSQRASLYFLRQIKKMEADLKITQATYDSLNALHTIEVGKLARFGGREP